MDEEREENESLPVDPRRLRFRRKFNVPWADIAMRIVIWLLLGSAINIAPPVIAYLLGAGDPRPGVSPLTVVLSSGDLLIAATAMLPLSLADLAINGQRARHARIIVVVFGAMLVLTSLMIYCFAFANYLSEESHQAMIAKHLSPDLVAQLSVAFFLTAVVLGCICTAFLAAGDEEGSTEGSKDNDATS
jgi:multisubunit Na+/H+ antiporter MnhC subunit